MGVNLATVRSYYFAESAQSKRNLLGDAIVPLTGFVFCFAIWMSLPRSAKIVGGCWLLGGIAYDAIKTRGFSLTPAAIDFSEP